MQTAEAIRDYQRRYQLRRRYAERYGLRPASFWDLPDDAELTYAQRVVQVAAPAPHPDIIGPVLACCGAWHAVTTMPFVCPACTTVYLEEKSHAV